MEKPTLWRQVTPDKLTEKSADFTRELVFNLMALEFEKIEVRYYVVSERD
jgi:hypothetical protein